MIKVYVLEFTRTYADREDTELSIGIYTTEAKAKSARDLLKDKKGLGEQPSGFTINEIELDLTGWRDGFITRLGHPPLENFAFEELTKTRKPKFN